MIDFGSLLVGEPGLWIILTEVERCMTTHRPSTLSIKSAIISFRFWMSIRVDIAFVIDATGPMAAAIQAVDAKMSAIAKILRDGYPMGHRFQFAALGDWDKLDDDNPIVSSPFSADPGVCSVGSQQSKRWMVVMFVKIGFMRWISFQSQLAFKLSPLYLLDR
jgi:hypothetical protein